MSLTPSQSPPLAWPSLSRRLIVVVVTLALVAGVLGLLAHFVTSLSPVPPPPPRNPFGGGMPREALPSTTGIGGLLLAWQSSFYRELTAALKAIHQSPAALWSLMALAFGYGVFHAAGPGHGKAVISGYIVADNRSLRRGLGLSFAAAILQALVAIALVSTLTLALRATAQTMTTAADMVEQASFALVALVGLFVLWRKAGALLALGHGAQAHDPTCDHVHMPGPEEISRLKSWREMAGVVFAAGLRPCAGALIILVFSASQGLLWAGIAAAFAMALGTALTTGALAALAVFFKFAALRLAGGGTLRSARLIAGLELLAAGFVAVLGAALFFGLWAAGAGS
ncbi:nickel/cobalt transporter [Bosea psychrotolerans]|uniref:Nickel/cobalt efflux system n=1 Tax=Bosea psychrotolerans TaxID=1871628 RepID=A0A2S4LWD5_9HYPH|nr:nickel/cobalt transporter [Bosea psychrotolerans]POR46763.1 ABC-type nickel/cobalt efflux system permease component RcnA [Bosea psychrotolerans]